LYYKAIHFLIIVENSRYYNNNDLISIQIKIAKFLNKISILK